MIKMSSEEFNKTKERIKFVPLEFSSGFESIKSDSKFFGTELGQDVLVIQLWNNDFCTSSFVVPNSRIATDGVKYTICPTDRTQDYVNSLDTGVDLSLMPMNHKEESDEEADASIDQRMAAIMASNTDHENKYPYEPVVEEAEPEVPVEPPTTAPIHKTPDIVPAHTTAPIITKGRQKPEEEEKKPEPKAVIARKTPDRGIPVRNQIYRPATKPTPPAEDPFAGW